MREDTRITLRDAVDFLKDLPPDEDTGPLIQAGEAILKEKNPNHFDFVDWSDAFVKVLGRS
jgi:hypothetical protein